MPEYKKKKVRKLGKPASRKKIKNQNIGEFKFDKKRKGKTFGATENIEMTPLQDKKSNSVNKSSQNVRVITGRKLIRRHKMHITAIVCAVIACAALILHYLLPVGILENVGNLTKLIGSGSLPIELYGTQAMYTETKSNYFYVLTDSELKAVSAGGKKIYSVSHGFASPILKTSETRALLFDQNGKELDIFNLSGKVHHFESENNILTAAVSRNGTYAVVTESSEYAASVSVYSKNNKLLYEWYSAADLVNNVCISPDGKKLAVSTLNAVDSTLNSKLMVLNFEGPDAIFTALFQGSVIYSVNNSYKGFIASSSNEITYIDWKEFRRQDYKSDRNLSLSKTNRSGNVSVFNLSSNKADNRIAVFSNEGEKISEFDFEGIISDIVMAKNHIYCVSDTNIYLYDKKGSLLSVTPCGFGVKKIAVISSNRVATVTNGEINKIELTEKGVE